MNQEWFLNLPLPAQTPVSPPRAIDPRVFCRPIRARARAKPGDGGRSLQVFELLHGDLSRVNLRLNAVDQGDAVVVRGDDRAVRTDCHVRDKFAAGIGKGSGRHAQRFQDLICHVVFSLQIHCTAERCRNSRIVGRETGLQNLEAGARSLLTHFGLSSSVAQCSGTGRRRPRQLLNRHPHRRCHNMLLPDWILLLPDEAQ